MNIPTFQKKLLSWYQKNQRNLPWRINQDPYRVWISEIMLQQTQVQTVIPYYEKFLKKFPDVFALANATEEDVLAYWAGLGYYRRARQLHSCAKIISEKNHFPDSAKDWQQLPGIGPYTAAAIASIAFKEPIAVVDGNVIRVIARLYALSGHAKAPALKLSVNTIAQTLVDTKNAGDFNQAMMELGATVCTPQKPQCPNCPVKLHCQAHKRNQAANIPTIPPKKQIKKIQRIVLVIAQNQQILIKQRPSNAKWLPQFYAPLEWWDTPEPFDFKQWQNLLKNYFLPIKETPLYVGKTKHTITHHHIISNIYSLIFPNKLKIPPHYEWIHLTNIKNKAIANLDHKVFKLINSIAFKR